MSNPSGHRTPGRRHLLAGCSGSGSDGVGPTDPTSGNGNPGTGSSARVPREFRPALRRAALPDRPLFQRLDRRHAEQPGHRRSCRMPPRSTRSTATRRTLPRRPVSRRRSIRRPCRPRPCMIEVDVDKATKATVGFRRLLVYGTDFTARVAPTVDSGGATLEIIPLKPLTPSDRRDKCRLPRGPDQRHRDTDGNAATPDRDYHDPERAADLRRPHRVDERHLPADRRAAPADGRRPRRRSRSERRADFSFSTQATADTMNIAAALAQPGPIGVVADRAHPADANAALPPIANIYVGQLAIPYYHDPAEPADRPLGRRAGRPGRAVDEPRRDSTRCPSPRRRSPCRSWSPCRIASGRAKPVERLAGRDLPARHHGQPHAGGRHRGRLRVAGLRRRRDRHAAPRHHRPGQPALPGRAPSARSISTSSTTRPARPARTASSTRRARTSST